MNVAKDISFRFRRKKYEVQYWKDILVKLSGVLATEKKEEFNKVLQIKGKIRGGRPYFSRNPDELRAPKIVPYTNIIYVETNWPKNSIIKISSNLVTFFGYKSEDFEVIEPKKQA